MMVNRQSLTQWVLAAAIAGVGATASVQAAPIAYEGFDYTAGQVIHGQNGGLGFGANAWTRVWGSEVVNASTPGATYGALDVVGGRADIDTLMIPNGSSGFPRFKLQRALDMSAMDPGLLDAGKFGKTGTSLWGSVIMQNANTAGADGLQVFNLTFGATRLGDLGGGANTTWGVRSDINNPSLGVTSSVAATTESLLVFRFDFNAGADDVFLWVNPDLNTFNPLTTVADVEVTAATAPNRPDISFNNITIEGGTNGSGTAGQTFTTSTGAPYGFIDEIRLGTTAADVLPIPEPATVGLVCLGGLMMISSRRGR